MGEDDLDDDQLQESPLFTADHRPCGVAVFPVSVEPTVGRGNAVGAVSYTHLTLPTNREV